MATGNKAYVVINGDVQAADPTTGATVGFSYMILDSGNSFVTPPGAGSIELRAPFNYGDSDQAIRQSVVSVVRDAVSDPDLDVNFISG
jgi:hypothetical protein